MGRSARFELVPKQLKGCPQCHSLMLLMATNQCKSGATNKLYTCAACSYAVETDIHGDILNWLNSEELTKTI